MVEPIVVDMTNIFEKWLENLSDIIAAREIRNRIKRIEKGNLGDTKPIKRAIGISEFRVHIGKGYRLYYTRTGRTIILLLCGGFKDKQTRDIKRAVEIKSILEQGRRK